MTTSGLLPPGVRLFGVDVVAEARGVLIPLDFGRLPFAPRRAFVVRDVPPGTTRGGHAHRLASQALVAIAGSVEVEVRSGDTSSTIVLDTASRALVIDPGVWSAQTYLESGSALLVLASEPYSADSYVEPSEA
jgi:dTDP-4-dehydrorhamnose 3,5-epimerase-like enzyme